MNKSKVTLPGMRDRDQRAGWVVALAAWLLTAVVMWLIRLRGQTDWYVGFHRWMSNQGLADWARNLDSDVIMMIALVVVWLVVSSFSPRRRESILADLGLVGQAGWMTCGLGIGVLIGCPMLLFAVVTALIGGGLPPWSWSMIPELIAAPINEEIFYRGLLVFSVWRLSGLNFWTLAVLGGLLFGLGHASWTASGIAAGWQNVLVTFAGGVWYAWLAREWGARLGRAASGDIWVTMALHGVMNLSWTIVDAGNGAVGGIWPNIARGLTIAFSVALTLRLATRKRARPDGANRDR